MNFDSIHWFELILINQTWLLFLRLVHFFLASILIRYLLIILSINICNKMKHTSSIKFEVTLSTILNSIWKKLFEFLLQIWFFFDEFIRFFFFFTSFPCWNSCPTNIRDQFKQYRSENYSILYFMNTRHLYSLNVRVWNFFLPFQDAVIQ